MSFDFPDTSSILDIASYEKPDEAACCYSANLGQHSTKNSPAHSQDGYQSDSFRPFVRIMRLLRTNHS